MAPLPPQGPPPPGAWPLKDTIFTRVLGGGPLPQLDAPITYELCVDHERRRLDEISPLDGAPSVDERVAAALRKWRWDVFTSSGSPTGRSCWHARFTPSMAADGHKRMLSEVADPVQMFELVDDHEVIRSVKDPEGPHVVAAIRVDDRISVRQLLLRPIMGVDDPTVPVPTRPSDVAQRPQVPIPERFRRRHTGEHYRAVMGFCVQPSGSVTAGPIVPVLGVNSALIDSIQRWGYLPDKLRWCGLASFAIVPR